MPMFSDGRPDRPRPRPDGHRRRDPPVRRRAGQPGQGVHATPTRCSSSTTTPTTGRSRSTAVLGGANSRPCRLRLLADPRRDGGDRGRRPLCGHRLPAGRPHGDGGGVVRALLLGGAGFIGLHLARRLVVEGHEVTIVDDFSRGRRRRRPRRPARAPGGRRCVSADLTDAGDLGRPAARLGPDLPARRRRRGAQRRADPARVVRVNTLAALHLIDWVGPDERVFFASTSEVYAGGVDAGIVAGADRRERRR